MERIQSVARAAVACLLGLVATAPLAGGLTDLERRWLAVAEPVFAEARLRRLPLDVVVQPQPNAGESPVAMAFVAGRCKLVLTLRAAGDPTPPAAGVDPGLANPMVEAMFAHELAHCWRHTRGAWRAAPAGFAAPRAAPGAPAEVAALVDAMHATRLEEGFADLVALAWTQTRHPDRYPEVHAWLQAVRGDPPADDVHHDTRAWLALAADPTIFGRAGSVFDRAGPPWEATLAGERAAAPDGSSRVAPP